MKTIFKQKNKNGYTIIETMIAISLFIIIVMMAMNALLNANVVSNKSQKTRSIMDNMSFVIEDMSRSLRTGTTYDCISDGSIPGSPTATSGYGCGEIAFKPANGGNMWIYYIGQNASGKDSLFKKIDNAPAVQITPDEVSIDPISGYSVLGAEPLGSGDYQQPFVTIRLVGTITYQKVTTSFSLQTSVSERNLDI